MKKFLIKFLLVVCPVVLPLVLMEVAVRHIPNNYNFKNDFMTSQSEGLETLIMGNSHGYLGINPEYLDTAAFNLCNLAESMDYTNKLYTKFDPQLNNLKTLVIPISYEGMFLKNMGVSRYNYNLYYDLKINDYLVDNLEILNGNWIDLITDCYSYYVDKTPSPYLQTSALGWFSEISDNKKFDYDRMEQLALRDTNNDIATLNYNIAIVKELISKLQKKGITLVMVSTPLHEGYRKFLDANQLNLLKTSAQQLADQSENVMYYNFMDSVLFEDSDFMDGDHLNTEGAAKFTRILNQLINLKTDLH